MSVTKFKSKHNNEIVFCCVDNIHTYHPLSIREVIKNIADYTISNITTKGFDVLVSHYEDEIINYAVQSRYKYAVVYSPGTEFINGESFFDNVKELVKTEFIVAGHVLDRGDAYYELHHQCYIINLDVYKRLGCPAVGQQELGSKHIQVKPVRSLQNIHDDYTPTWINAGNTESQYNHKAHGWHIISVALENNIPILVFNNEIRKNKKHYYPESYKDFLKESEWLYYRQHYCSSTFVHTSSNEFIPEESLELKGTITQLFTPASGTWWIDHLHMTDPVKVFLYDYNQRALDYWKEHSIQRPNITYEFILLDLLGQTVDISFLDPNQTTMINLSNIFCYEGTMAFAPLTYRLYKENQILEKINNHIPNAYVCFCDRAATGFAFAPNFKQGMQLIPLSELNVPSWHQAGDWIV